MQPPKKKHPELAKGAESRKDRPHALVVDDNPAILDILDECLGQMNYRTTNVTNAPAALEVLKTDRVDVVISDYSMPEMDGVEFLKEIRELFPLDSPRFILISGTLFSPDVIRFVEECGAIFLRKPFRFSELTASLERLSKFPDSGRTSNGNTEFRPAAPSRDDSDMEIKL